VRYPSTERIAAQDISAAGAVSFGGCL